LNQKKSSKKKKILFVSNGHGEDHIAVKIIKRVQKISTPTPTIHAWPMVGNGTAYRNLNIPVIGVHNLLPSCGFATLSLKLMIKDLFSGWIQVHVKQIINAIKLRKKYSFIIAVGDIVPIVVSVIARTPFFFIGCAKSSYYSFLHGYTKLEKYLLKKYCHLVFPRDILTVKELKMAKVPVNFAGNPMMDDLEGSGERFDIPPECKIIGFLPGSRRDTEMNAVSLLQAAGKINISEISEPLQFLFAVPDTFDIEFVIRSLKSKDQSEWRIDNSQTLEYKKKKVNSTIIILKVVHEKGFCALFIKNRFADVLRYSTIVVGVAGMANEQAVGLGKPLITFPTRGVMGKQYVRMKMQFFGPSALEVSSKPESIARAIESLLDDKEKQQEMANAGKERMGEPGASRLIAKRIVSFLENEVDKSNIH
jgi:uncharacterized protein (TIGR03492 family)